MNSNKRLHLAAAGFTVLIFAMAACARTTPTPTATPRPSPTPTPAPTSTPSSSERAKIYAGQWSGSWHNETFDTTGSAEATVDIRDDGTFEVTWDLGGMVFGAIDPAPMTLTGQYAADGGATLGLQDDPTFGDVAITLSPTGELAGTVENVLGTAGRIELTGNLTPETLELHYTLLPAGAATAEGTLSLIHE